MSKSEEFHRTRGFAEHISNIEHKIFYAPKINHVLGEMPN